MSLFYDKIKDSILSLDNDAKKWFHRDVMDVAKAAGVALESEIQSLNSQIADLKAQLDATKITPADPVPTTGNVQAEIGEEVPYSEPGIPVVNGISDTIATEE